MLDLALNSDFSVFLNDRNELATVSGIDEFEQSVRVMVTDYLINSVIGEVDEATIKSQIRLQVSRVARKHNRLSDISEIDISKSETEANTYNLRIVFQSGAVTEFGVSE